MGALANTNPTLIDVAKATGPDGQIVQDIVEILTPVNEALEDMTFVEANDGTSHVTTIRAGLPQPTWRRLYQGVQPTKGSLVQIRDTLGMLQDYAEVDCKIADMSPDPARFRLIEDSAHIVGINNEVMQTLIYGNEGSAPAEFTGIAARYNSLSAENGENIYDFGGTGSDNTSIYLVTWGPKAAQMLYPRGSQGGLKSRDLGEVTVRETDGSMWQAYRSHYQWDIGFTLRDWRTCYRIANIDVSDLANTANMKALITALIQASEWVENAGMGRPVFYANKKVRAALRNGILASVSNQLTFDTVAGKRVMAFDGIPFRRCDAILNTEARVV